MPVKDSTLDSGGRFACLRFIELILRSLPTGSALVDDGALKPGGRVAPPLSSIGFLLSAGGERAGKRPQVGFCGWFVRIRFPQFDPLFSNGVDGGMPRQIRCIWRG